MSAAKALKCPLVPMHPLPRVTADLAGAGGVIRVEPEDFEVEEMAAYEPCGSGEHLYLWLQKRDLSGGHLRRIVSRALRVQDRDVGMAGLKDRRAVTRQWISVPAVAEQHLNELTDTRIKVLRTDRHTNKLRTGHLRGNRFKIRIRDTAPGGVELVSSKLQRLAVAGMPNFYGSQRMGIGGSTLAAGWALAAGADRSVLVTMPDGTEHKINLRDRHLRRLAASALQSELFNRVLAARMRQGLLGSVLDGELCRKRDTGGMFVSTEQARDQTRMDAGEIGATGPMWGPKMRRPGHAAAAWEAAIMVETGLSEAHFAAIGSLAPGTRRMLRCWPAETNAVQDEHGVVANFTLPAGAFATVLLHELCGPVEKHLTPRVDKACA